MWVEHVASRRAYFSLRNAQQSSQPAEALASLSGQRAAAIDVYTRANDSLRSRAAEMRLRQPSVAAEALNLWKASMVHGRARDEDAWDPDDGTRREAESAFIAKVRERMNELE